MYLLISLGVVVSVALWAISEPTILFSDFYKAYFDVADGLWRNGPSPTWLVNESPVIGFVNLPIFAWLFVPLVPLGSTGAGWTFFVMGIIASACACALLIRMADPSTRPGGLLVFFFLINGPLINSLREGNTTHFTLLLLIVALSSLGARREYLAGLILGACAIIKLPLLLYGLYFAMRGRWRVVAGGATMIAAAGLLSVIVFGTDINIGWYQNCVEPFLGRFIAAFNVQSIDAFLIRLETGGENLRNWDVLLEPSIFHKVARLLLIGVAFGGASWLLLRPADPKRNIKAHQELAGRNVLEYVSVLLLAIVLSPLSWTHYYLLLLLPWGLYLGGRLPLPDDAATCFLMRAGFLLSMLPTVVFESRAESIDFFMSRTLVSSWLFGGLGMLAALTRGLIFLRQGLVSNQRYGDGLPLT
jgi:alpha-1,2-mannosyltransferase